MSKPEQIDEQDLILFYYSIEEVTFFYYLTEDVVICSFLPSAVECNEINEIRTAGSSIEIRTVTVTGCCRTVREKVPKNREFTFDCPILLSLLYVYQTITNHLENIICL